MRVLANFRGLHLAAIGFVCSALTATALVADDGALSGGRHRVLISTDVGGTDPDDIQSMAHLLVYADCFDLEGLVSSPYGSGRKEQILEAIVAYEKDYPNLATYSDKYPKPDALRAITKQGSKEIAGGKGVSESTEGSRWIIECAKRDDPRPLHVLVWGGIEPPLSPRSARPSSHPPESNFLPV